MAVGRELRPVKRHDDFGTVYDQGRNDASLNLRHVQLAIRQQPIHLLYRMLLRHVALPSGSASNRGDAGSIRVHRTHDRMRKRLDLLRMQSMPGDLLDEPVHILRLQRWLFHTAANAWGKDGFPNRHSLARPRCRIRPLSAEVQVKIEGIPEN